MLIRQYSAFLLIAFALTVSANAAQPPNIIYIMSDELAYFELGHMGNDKVRTPRIDQFAKDGLRFTHAYAGSCVCAPLRCNLMTGKHAGHASVRANDGGTPLREGEATIASMLKAKGYATGGFGKWGCGGRDSTGVPENHGFDVFFGYYDQVHAHSFYPPYLVRNSEEAPLAGNVGGRSGETYSHYVIMREALDFIRKNKDQPFFCYLPITPPHGMYDIPADDPAWKEYAEVEWVQDEAIPQDVKNYAAMVTMVDRNLGEVLDLLSELGLEDNTIVFFTGDNGGQDRFRSQQFPRGFFGPNVHPKTGVEFRGGKGNLYEGGLRIPFLVRWPGRIESGRVSNFVFYQPDMLPTLAELTQAKAPQDIDGLSILPEILGRSDHQKQHEFLYWEFGAQTAVRVGDWKALRPRPNASWELYNVATDVSEKENVAEANADVVQRLQAIAEREHEPVRAGKYLDPQRVRHERDRWAKWGNTRPPKRTPKSVQRIREKNLIGPDSLTLVSASSENTGNNRLAKYAIDGNPTTVWHSQFTTKLAKHPHELVIDLGAEYEVSGLRYLARQDGGWNGAFADVEIYVAKTKGGFEDQAGKATFIKTRQVQKSDFTSPAKGRYVKIRILSEVNGNPWASAADIGIIGRK